jgi:hypothetical protein
MGAPTFTQNYILDQCSIGPPTTPTGGVLALSAGEMPSFDSLGKFALET